MKQYLKLLRTIQKNGYFTGDRTGVGTQALPGYSYQCILKKDGDVIHDYPLLTTKKMFLRGTFEELMWKLRGETNIQSLVKKKVYIWNEWPFKKWLEKTGLWGTFPLFIDEAKSDYTDEWKSKMAEYIKLICEDDDFAKEFGELGPTYGHNFRRFGEVKDKHGNIVREGEDQLMETIHKIKNKPEDRRNIITLWDPHANKLSLLPPCPCFYQIFANEEGYLHLNLYQRSCDTFLGVPFNTSQDSLMLILLAKVTGRTPKIFNHFFGDAHIYNNHQKQVAEQLSRDPFPLPSIKINRETDNIFDFVWEDIELINYQHHPVIKAPVAV